MVLTALLLSVSGLAPGQDSSRVERLYRKMEVMIPMRDGVKLFTAVYLPKDTLNTYPILLNRTPYGARPYGADQVRSSLGPSDLEAEEGFIFVYQDVRGRYLSEGTFVDVRPYIPHKTGPQDVDESTDTHDTIKWLLAHLQNANGKVGITGISYPGFYTTMGLIDAHPALVAGSPQAPIADWFVGDDAHHNGALFLAETFSFFANFGQIRQNPLTKYPTRFRMPSSDAYSFFLSTGTTREAGRLYMGDSIPFWNDLMTHENYDAFWKARSVLPHLRGIRPAVLTVGGWFDKEDLFGALNTYKTIEKNSPKTLNIIVMGPWSHGQWARGSGESLGDITFGSKTSEWFREHVQFPFFQWFLKGKGSGKFPEATVFETGANRWHFLASWPPRNLKDASFYLGARGRLTRIGPNPKGLSYSEFVSDPAHPVPHTEEIGPSVRPAYMVEDQRFAARRPDVLVFSSDPLREDITFAGPVTASLYVSTTGTDADWVVKVIDVFPDDSVSAEETSHPLGGFQMLVRGDVMRGKFRKSFSKPAAFRPGQVTKVEFTLQDVLHRFKRRHRIMVQVQSSWFPLVDRNPQKFTDIYQASAEDFQKATHRVYHTAVYPSKITVGLWNPPPPVEESHR